MHKTGSKSTFIVVQSPVLILSAEQCFFPCALRRHLWDVAVSNDLIKYSSSCDLQPPPGLLFQRQLCVWPWNKRRIEAWQHLRPLDSEPIINMLYWQIFYSRQRKQETKSCLFFRLFPRNWFEEATLFFFRKIRGETNGDDVDGSSIFRAADG